MTWKGYLLMLIPALFDFFATYLMNFALILVSSSIFQMMKGCVIFFTTILAVVYRKQKLFMYEIVGVIILVISLVVVGSAAFCPGYQEEAESSLTGSTDISTALLSTFIGIILILIGQYMNKEKNI